ncbi:MAG: C4-dicarboxylate ABC transporter substrate-binding protein, partial [Firmicutes bacterium]|nr:C4-dicarboxylate ABC transporter substrate-binding protein [Bacillota bacterium]
MKKKHLSGILVFLLLVSLIITGCSSGAAKDGKKEGSDSKDAKPIVLKYAFFAPASTFPAKQMEKWKEELEKRTNNKVKVELFPGGTLLTDKNMYDGVKDKV